MCRYNYIETTTTTDKKYRSISLRSAFLDRIVSLLLNIGVFYLMRTSSHDMMHRCMSSGITSAHKPCKLSFAPN